MNWNVLGDGFGWRKGMYGIEWIYWAPGSATQEGEVGWADAGVQYRIHGALVRSDSDLHDEIKEKALPLMKADLAQRLTPRADIALSDEICKALGGNYSAAMLFSKTWLGSQPHILINRFRHQCTNYDFLLAEGTDRFTANLRAANKFLEILAVYEQYKERILSCNTQGDVLSAHIALAKLPHTHLRRITIDLLNARRLDSKVKAG